MAKTNKIENTIPQAPKEGLEQEKVETTQMAEQTNESTTATNNEGEQQTVEIPGTEAETNQEPVQGEQLNSDLPPVETKTVEQPNVEQPSKSSDGGLEDTKTFDNPPMDADEPEAPFGGLGADIEQQAKDLMKKH